MDGDLPANRQDISQENREQVYYLCASQFGWDKETVDKQPIDYLKGLMKAYIKANKQDSTNQLKSKLPRGMRKNF